METFGGRYSCFIVCVRVSVYVCICVCVCVSVYVCMSVCVPVSVHAFLHVCMCVSSMERGCLGVHISIVYGHAWVMFLFILQWDLLRTPFCLFVFVTYIHLFTIFNYLIFDWPGEECPGQWFHRLLLRSHQQQGRVPVYHHTVWWVMPPCC